MCDFEYPNCYRYLSEVQYKAMQLVDTSKSLIPLMEKNTRTNTVSSLFRNKLIEQKIFTDEDGVVREGWQISAVGRNSMNFYDHRLQEEEKERQRRLAWKLESEERMKQMQMRQEQHLEKLKDAAKEYYKSQSMANFYKNKCTQLTAEKWLMHDVTQEIYRMAEREISQEMQEYIEKNKRLYEEDRYEY